MNFMRLKIVSILMALNILAFLFLIFLAADPIVPFTYKTPVNKMLTPVVPIGGMAVMEVDVVQNTNGKRVTVSRQLESKPVNGRSTLTVLQTVTYLSRQGRQILESHMPIPTGLPAGVYRFVLYNEVDINPLRTVRYTRYSDWFEVVATGGAKLK